MLKVWELLAILEQLEPNTDVVLETEPGSQCETVEFHEDCIIIR
jgi:hypothetical protein